MTDTESHGALTLSDIPALTKGLPVFPQSLAPDQISRPDWNLLREDLPLPAAVLYEDRLQHNLDWMQRFVDRYGLKLAPHGKTTMAPKLFTRQIAAGAWGITLATAHQTLVAYEHGVRRVLMANQLVGKANMAIIAHLLEDPQFEYYCLVDSAEQVDQLGAFFSSAGRQVNVLIELGVAGGRSGVRDDGRLAALVNGIGHWNGSVALCGIELYEGVLVDEAAIRAFLLRAVVAVRTLAGGNRFARSPVLLSGAGSVWYDIVAETFSAADFGASVEIALRPGCYLTHDVGLYREAQENILQRNPIARQMGSGLIPALQVWAYVQSIPEEGRAIVGMGKRDVSFDSGLPTPATRYRPGEIAPMPAPGHWTVAKLMDQHAFLQIVAGDDLRTGDMIAFDISHPCLTFDKWRAIPVVNAQYQVIDIVQTFF